MTRMQGRWSATSPSAAKITEAYEDLNVGGGKP